MHGWHVALPFDGLADGGRSVVVVGHEQVLLVRAGNEVFATQAACPHKFGPLAEGALEGTLLTCPLHAATFDLRTGQARPGGVWSGPLHVYPVRVREGLVEVQVTPPA